MSRKRNTPNIWVFVVVGCILAVIGGAWLYQGSAYAGGWEVVNSVDKVIIDGNTKSYDNLHSITWDVDDSFNRVVNEANSYSGIYPGPYDDPDIYVHTSYPYYMRPYGAAWEKADSPYLFQTYDREMGEELIRYNHYVFGYDITIQTKADAYLKPFGSYIDYGWFYEANVVDVSARVNFGINPWAPSGIVDDVWEVVGGWAGVMSASCIKVESGLIQSGAEENRGHTITGLNSVGDALNMFGGSPVDFEDSAAIANVPQEISIENQATLGAGAKYTTDFIGHWDSLAVRNVFVKYTVRVDVVTVLEYELVAGAPLEQEPPTEDNTVYQPEITPWKNFLEWTGGVTDWFNNLGMPMIIVIVVAVVIIVVVIYVVRPIMAIRGRRK
ncbi:MAG: hypothetical protein ACTSWQ_00450 [Candidatus Thorarchaeota archaeon]